ncbi:hypothetical protein V3W47_13995 [Deinococcus sp. YIM 134068]|uniref:hypothetical protein n=1 Tax=Deinococcus lichenicola TaxID=3118910 RepID=UPI002F9336DD
MAEEYGCYVEYGAYPHLKLHENDQEVAAVQDWTTFGTVYLRLGYERTEELLRRLAAVLRPAAP